MLFGDGFLRCCISSCTGYYSSIFQRKNNTCESIEFVWCFSWTIHSWTSFGQTCRLLFNTWMLYYSIWYYDAYCLRYFRLVTSGFISAFISASALYRPTVILSEEKNKSDENENETGEQAETAKFVDWSIFTDITFLLFFISQGNHRYWRP